MAVTTPRGGETLPCGVGPRAYAVLSECTRDQTFLSVLPLGDLFVWVFTLFFIFFKVLDAFVGNRVSAEVEMEGLDIPEMDAIGYLRLRDVAGPGWSRGGPLTAAWSSKS